MRNRKEKLKQSLKEKLHILEDIQREIPKNRHLKPPPMPQEYAEEYMEKNLEVVITVPKEPPNPTAITETVIHYVMVITIPNKISPFLQLQYSSHQTKTI